MEKSFQTGEISQFSCRRIITETLIRFQIDDKSNQETKSYDSVLDNKNLTGQIHKTNDKSGQLKVDMAGKKDVVTIIKNVNEKEIFQGYENFMPQSIFALLKHKQHKLL